MSNSRVIVVDVDVDAADATATSRAFESSGRLRVVRTREVPRAWPSRDLTEFTVAVSTAGYGGSPGALQRDLLLVLRAQGVAVQAMATRDSPPSSIEQWRVTARDSEHAEEGGTRQECRSQEQPVVWAADAELAQRHFAPAMDGCRADWKVEPVDSGDSVLTGAQQGIIVVLGVALGAACGWVRTSILGTQPSDPWLGTPAAVPGIDLACAASLMTLGWVVYRAARTRMHSRSAAVVGALLAATGSGLSMALHLLPIGLLPAAALLTAMAVFGAGGVLLADPRRQLRVPAGLPTTLIGLIGLGAWPAWMVGYYVGAPPSAVSLSFTTTSVIVIPGIAAAVILIVVTLTPVMFSWRDEPAVAGVGAMLGCVVAVLPLLVAALILATSAWSLRDATPSPEGLARHLPPLLSHDACLLPVGDQPLPAGRYRIIGDGLDPVVAIAIPQEGRRGVTYVVSQSDYAMASLHACR